MSDMLGWLSPDERAEHAAFDAKRAKARKIIHPVCQYGYSISELCDLLGHHYKTFTDAGMNTDTTLYCSGQVYDAETMEFWDGCGPHGPVFDRGRVDVWLEDAEENER